MKKKRKRRIIAGIAVAALTFTSVPAGMLANASSPAAADIGYPEFKNVELLDEVYDLESLGVSYSEDDIMMKIYEQDLANGGDSFYMDRILAREGVANGNAGSNGNDDANTFLTRGRALYMYTSNPAVIGFGGTVAYHQQMTGDMYSITFQSGGSSLTTSEDTSSRVNYPSNWVSTYSVGDSLAADVTKFISQENVAVTAITLRNTSGADQNVTVNATSSFVSERGEVEINGNMASELTGSVTSPSNLTQITTRLTGDGFGYTDSNQTLAREVTVPAGGSVDLKVVMAFTTEEIPESTEDYIRFSGMANLDAIRTQKAEYNLYWAENLPYVDVPNKAVQKAIDYRWWSERFNSLDANIPGYDYQYPVTIEGVLGYNNAIALTQPMHLQDTKWLRSAYLPYGQLLSIGNSSQSSAFLDNPGNRSNWNNHYGQYMAESGLDAFNVIGGGSELAENLAYYFEHDATGQLEHYGNHTDYDLIAYQSNYMTGNDADTISMNSATGVGQWKIHGENAYVWAAANSAAQLYEMLGNTEKAEEMKTLADSIQEDVLNVLWCEECQKFETYGVSPTRTLHNPDQPHLVDLTESNNYNYFSVGLVPTDEASIEKYKVALEAFSNGEEFPIFPFFTANQVDNQVVAGSNNFSNINFTVQARVYESALRTYDKEQEYITDDMLAMMVEWMAWNIYPDSGDVRYPNNNEFYNIDGRTLDTYYRSWIYHNILGNYNYIFFEDMAGIQPRSDEKIELSPIDFSYDHFMVNNARYHGQDITVVWDAPDDGVTYYDGLPEGYSLFINGELVFTLDELAHVIYDSSTGELEFPDGEAQIVTLNGSAAIPSAMDTSIADEKVTAMFEKSGIHGMENLAEGAEVEATYTPSEAREAAWAEKHRADGTDPTSQAVNETVPDPQAVTDGTTVNMPFWGNYESPNEKDSLIIHLGSDREVDMAALYFYNDRQTGGYAEPEKYTVEYWDGSSWQHVQNQSRDPLTPKANYNNVKFQAVTTDQLRFTFTNLAGHYTAVTEIQVFAEGGERIPTQNTAPQVSLRENTSAAGNLQASITATCVDDGMPYDQELTYTWEVVGKPDNAEAFIGSPDSLTTTLAGSAEGDYTIRFTANDGEFSSSAEIKVTLTPSETQAREDVALKATPSTDYVAGWETITGINNASFEPASSNVGTGYGWGNWGCAGGTGSTHWVAYTWNDPVTINSSEIYWYDDRGGTRIPSSISMQYRDEEGNWQDVNITTPFDQANRRNQYNTIEFDTITTTELRLNMVLSAAGTGIYRFKVYSVPIERIEPVYIGTMPGVMPELPSTVNAWTADGQLVTTAVTWDPLTEDMIANDGTVTINGINLASGKFTTATIYVRSDMDQATISTVDSVEVSTPVGKIPNLPKTIGVSYNNGAHDNQNVAVTWPEITEDQVASPGDFTIQGTVEGTTTLANLTVHVFTQQADKAALQEMIAAARALDEKDYTAASFAPIREALEAALQVYDNEAATQEEVNSAAEILRTAIAGRVGLKDQLNQEIAFVQGLNSENYTEESYAELTEALNEAVAVSENDEATEEEVNQAVEKLLAAIDALVRSGTVDVTLDLSFDRQSDITLIKDNSANGFDASSETITEENYVEGVSGTAIQFNGTTSFEVPAGASIATEDISLSYWIRRTGDLTGDVPILWAKNDSTYNGNGFYTNYPTNEQYSSFFVVDGFNGFYVAENPNTFLPLNEWTYITVTWDSEMKIGKIYKNGEEQAVTVTGAPQSITGSENAVNRFGESGYPGAYTSNIALDEFKIYNGVLSQEAINALYNEFNTETVDMSVLQQLIENWQPIDASKYTQESVQTLMNALTRAQEMLINGASTQAEVDNMVKELQDAITGLVPVDTPTADKTALQTLFDSSQSIDSALYTEESIAVLQTAMNGAFQVLSDQDATQEEVDAAVQSLQAAIDGLVLIGDVPQINMAALQQMTDQAKAIDRTLYTEESLAALDSVLAQAEAMLAEGAESQEEVDAMTASLQSALNGLIEIPTVTPADKARLEKVIAEAESRVQDDYTGDTWAAFAAALQSAKDTQDDELATQEEVDAAALALQEAMDALVEAGKPDADTSGLEEALESVQALNKNNYTAESWTALEKAVADAQAVLQNKDATQEEIDAAAQALLDAIDGLVRGEPGKEPVDPDRKPQTGDSGSSGKGDGGKNTGARTGDTAPIAVTAVTAAAALAVISVVLVKKRKNR